MVGNLQSSRPRLLIINGTDTHIINTGKGIVPDLVNYVIDFGS
jgi:hypothetical protein